MFWKITLPWSSLWGRPRTWRQCCFSNGHKLQKQLFFIMPYDNTPCLNLILQWWLLQGGHNLLISPTTKCFLSPPDKFTWWLHQSLQSPPMPPVVPVDFLVFRPGHGRSVTDFGGWDAHEARLHCPDDVSGDIGGCSARRALKPKFY